MKFKFKALGKIINEHYILFCVMLSFVLNFTIECAARISLTGGILYITKHPFYFLYNVILLLLTFSVSLLFKKRIFSVLLVGIWWLISCVTNCVLIHFRHTPFTAADFFVAKSAFDVMHLYISKPQMILIIAFSVISIVTLVALIIKEKPKTPDYRKLSVLLAVTIIMSLLPIDFISAKKTQSPKSNLTDEAYEYGFVCCFLNSIFNDGINEPDVYSESSINSILKKIKTKEKEIKEPNIVVIQLESFVDPYIINTAKFNKDPIPNFRRLKEKYSSGKLGVSVYGGGTANTEFEVLTGMSTNFFGIGEYPYESTMHTQTVESVCYNLDEIGYTSHAIHNHTGTFYDRYLVYKNLGFDIFTPIEYMNNVTLNALGWAKSDVFTDLVLDSLKKTSGKDFVFTVTSQGHGKYPDKINPDFKYKLTDGSDRVMEMKGELEYYINELHEEDIWLGEMMKALAKFPEPVLAIIYGDHMPSLNSPDELLDKDNIYSTEYIIWSNFYTPKINANLETYNLLPAALNMVNINNGILTKLHQYGLNSGEIYSDDLHNIQYDMLYGKKYVYEKNKIPYEPTNMKLGIYDISIENVEIDGDMAVISGNNFTPYSIVCVDGNEISTNFVNKNTLEIPKDSCKDYEEIIVIQKSTNFIVLSETKPYINNNEQ